MRSVPRAIFHAQLRRALHLDASSVATTFSSNRHTVSSFTKYREEPASTAALEYVEGRDILLQI